jgi:predicted RNase H-like HicB family nuclease
MRRSGIACGGGVNFKIQFEREEDARWIADISELPGVMAYGSTQAEVEAAVETLAAVIPDGIEAEKVGQKTISFATA